MVHGKHAVAIEGEPSGASSLMKVLQVIMVELRQKAYAFIR